MRQLLFIALICSVSLSYGQKLRFKVAGVKDTTVFLTKYFGKGLYYADTAEMKGGVAEFDVNKDIKPGIVALLLPGQKYFEFIYNNEDISMETDVKDLVGDLKIKKSEENKVFVPYIQYLQKQRTVANEISKQRESMKKGDADYKALTQKMDSIGKLVATYQKDLIKNNSTLFVSKVINMSMDVEIPESPKDANGKIIDSTFGYKFYRAHFWDNIDLKDDRMVNTPVFHQKLEYYFGKNMLLQHPDTVLNEAFSFIEGRLNKGSEVFKYVVDHITNSTAKSNIMGMDKVYIMMADRYYCGKDANGKSYAFWMKEDKLKELCEDIPVKKKLVYGVVPPNVILRDTTDKVWKDFYSLKSEYTVLYFWDPECGHCKKTTPKLQVLYEKKLKARNVEVFAVGKAMGEDFEKWKKFIRDNKLTFINVGLTESLYKAALEDARLFVPKFTNIESLNYHDTYDLYATPRIFLLDKDKKIIAKQLSISQLEDMLDRYQNIKNPEKLFEEDPEEDIDKKETH